MGRREWITRNQWDQLSGQRSNDECHKFLSAKEVSRASELGISRFDDYSMNMRFYPLLILVFLLFCTGCGPKVSQQTIDRVRSEVAEVLGKDPAQIDIAKPLVEQGADDLDIVETVMAVEEAFKIEIPDSAIGEKVDEVGKTLTVQKLAKIVSKQQKK